MGDQPTNLVTQTVRRGLHNPAGWYDAHGRPNYKKFPMFETKEILRSCLSDWPHSFNRSVDENFLETLKGHAEWGAWLKKIGEIPGGSTRDEIASRLPEIQTAMEYAFDVVMNGRRTYRDVWNMDIAFEPAKTMSDIQKRYRQLEKAMTRQLTSVAGLSQTSIAAITRTFPEQRAYFDDLIASVVFQKTNEFMPSREAYLQAFAQTDIRNRHGREF